MKIKVLIADKEYFVNPKELLIDGVTFSDIIKRLVRLENEFNAYKKQQEEKTIKLNEAWNKVRGYAK